MQKYGSFNIPWQIGHVMSFSMPSNFCLLTNRELSKYIKVNKIGFYFFKCFYLINPIYTFFYII